MRPKAKRKGNGKVRPEKSKTRKNNINAVQQTAEDISIVGKVQTFRGKKKGISEKGPTGNIRSEGGEKKTLRDKNELAADALGKPSYMKIVPRLTSWGGEDRKTSSSCLREGPETPPVETKLENEGEEKSENRSSIPKSIAGHYKKRNKSMVEI